MRSTVASPALPARSWRLPPWGWGVLLALALAGSAVSLAAWRYARSSEQEANRAQFERQVHDTARDLQERLDAAQRLLRSGAALFAASDEVSSADWKAFADAQALEDSYPGLLGVGYVQHQGAHALVLYREPQNRRAIGLDLFGDPVRREAMERAAENAGPALSSAAALLSGPDAQRRLGALLFVPVYRQHMSLDTPAQRRAALEGWVYTPFDLPQLLGPIARTRADDLAVELWDGPMQGGPTQRLFESHAQTAAQIADFHPSHRAERVIELGGRRWWLRVATLPTFDAGQPRSHAQLVLAGGLAITALVTLLVGVLLDLRSRALRLAKRLSSAYRESEARVRTVLDNAGEGILTVDARGDVLSANPAARSLLGLDAHEALGQSLSALLPIELDELITPLPASGPRLWRRELRLCRIDGRDELRLLVAASELHLDDGACHYVLLLADVSELERERERAEEASARNDRNESTIRHMAHHDELTGLPNRALLQHHTSAAIEAARGSGKQLAVLLIDLDRFKQINDSLGHHAGDVVLCAVAARLKGCLRTSDTVARMGGDEFVVLLPQIDGPQHAERVAAKLLQAMAEPVQAGPHRLTVTPSIGIACHPHDGEDLTTLLRNADVAMYESKASGRNTSTLYTPAMHTGLAKRLELEGELRQAIERGQLELHYQPLVRLPDGGVVGVEALLRWNHPERGTISPVDFIPIAEDTGLIVPIGEWVLRTACFEMKELERRSGRRLKVAVNLSPRQLRIDLTPVIAQALQDSGWRAEDLELEITESTMIEQPERSIAALQRLRAMGVGLSIDDFGTGYSSLSYLARLPVAKLKLDRSFVRGLPYSERDAAIATSVVALGHGLKLQVLAEGIETEAQAQFLRELGCQMGQGWLFAKPMPLAALERRLGEPQAPLPVPVQARA